MEVSIKLEPFEEIDFDRLINWCANEDILKQFAGPLFTYPLTGEQLNKYINTKNRLVFKVIDLHNSSVIGHAELFLPDDIKLIKICRVLIGDKSNRRKGIGEKIIKKLLDIAFNDLKKEKVELKVFEKNIGAIKCYTKVGFRIVIGKTLTMTVKGKQWNALTMSINKE